MTFEQRLVRKRPELMRRWRDDKGTCSIQVTDDLRQRASSPSNCSSGMATSNVSSCRSFSDLLELDPLGGDGGLADRPSLPTLECLVRCQARASAGYRSGICGLPPRPARDVRSICDRTRRLRSRSLLNYNDSPPPSSRCY